MRLPLAALLDRARARVRVSLLTSAAGFALTACGNDPAAPFACAGPLSDVTVEFTPVTPISALATPEIQWAPDCLAGGLLVVEDANPSAVVWRFESVENSVPGPVRYGQVPEGVALSAESSVGPVALVPGRSYAVRVLRKRPYACGSAGCGYEWAEEGRTTFVAH